MSSVCFCASLPNSAQRKREKEASICAGPIALAPLQMNAVGVGLVSHDDTFHIVVVREPAPRAIVAGSRFILSEAS